MPDDVRAMLDELEALEKAATPPPWKEDANRLSILCDGINGGKPYEGYIGAMGYHDNRELTIAARNALPTLLRLARRAGEMEEVSLKLAALRDSTSHALELPSDLVEGLTGEELGYLKRFLIVAWRQGVEQAKAIVDAALKEPTND